MSEADRLGLDWLELDVCVTEGDALVLRHHGRLPGGCPVHAVSLAELRRMEPDILTLSEAIEHLAGHVPILVDVKSPRVVGPLVAWLRGHRHAGAFAICSESRSVLVHARETVPWVLRWRTLTALWRFGTDSVSPLLRPVFGDLFRGAIWSAADDAADAGSDLAAIWMALPGTEHVGERLRRIVAAAQRDELPGHVARLANEVGAAAISVDHWSITPRLCEVAHRLDLMVAAWTVNHIDMACDLARVGVDAITSDDVLTLRRALDLLGERVAATGEGVAVSRRPPPPAAPDATQCAALARPELRVG